MVVVVAAVVVQVPAALLLLPRLCVSCTAAAAAVSKQVSETLTNSLPLKQQPLCPNPLLLVTNCAGHIQTTGHYAHVLAP
jgi:hypothetical protein